MEGMDVSGINIVKHSNVPVLFSVFVVEFAPIVPSFTKCVVNNSRHLFEFMTQPAVFLRFIPLQMK
jgi:hypothetical protein